MSIQQLHVLMLTNSTTDNVLVHCTAHKHSLCCIVCTVHMVYVHRTIHMFTVHIYCMYIYNIHLHGIISNTLAGNGNLFQVLLLNG